MPLLESKRVALICIGGYAAFAAVFLFLMLDVGASQAVQSLLIDQFGTAPALAFLLVIGGQVGGILLAVLVSALVAGDQVARGYVWRAELWAYVFTFILWAGFSYYVTGSRGALANLDAGQVIIALPVVVAYCAAYLFPNGVPDFWTWTILTQVTLFTVILVAMRPLRAYRRVRDIRIN